MWNIRLCEACLRESKVNPKKKKINIATDKHHKFSRTGWAMRLYGAKYMDSPINLEATCNECNGSHASPYLTHWDEIDFCLAHGIEPLSKEGIELWKRRSK